MTRAPLLDEQDIDDGAFSGADASSSRVSQPVPSKAAIGAELLGTLGHDLNNPLAIVLTNLGFLSGLVKQIRSEIAQTPETAGDLNAKLDEAEVSLRDAQDALQRLRSLARTIADPNAGVPAPASHPKAVFLPVGQGSALRPARILIVDDEESLGRALSRLFRDYDVVVHVDPVDALDRILMGERFDVIISDVAMPRMSGCELHEEIRRVSPEQAERTVFLTGGQTNTRVAGQLAASGQPILSKPFDARELRSFIERFLRSTSMAPSASIGA